MAKDIAIDYSEWAEEQMGVLNTYLENNMAKLKKICKSIWGKNNIPHDRHDDLYDDAMIVLMNSLKTFSKGKGTSFDTYLQNSIRKSYSTWYRDNFLRGKRNNLMKDKNGRIKKDKEGKPIIVWNTSFDAPTDDGVDLKDRLCVEEEDGTSECVENYLKTLSKTEKEIASLIMDGYEIKDVKEILGISDKRFEKHLKSMSSFEKHRTLKHSDCIVEEETNMNVNYVNTMEKSKPDRLSIGSIIKKINNYTLRFDHPLQRESAQWTNVMMGNLVSDILQKNPLPALIFAEQIVNGIAIIWDIDGKQRCTVSYSFATNGFRVSKNVRRPIITYQESLKDENGKFILDDNGFPQTELKEFDIRNKQFSDLPEALQERFLDYNFEITQYLNCSSDDIKYHIERYNDGKSMNAQQKGIIRLGEDFAIATKKIAAMPFFKEMGNYTLRECHNGTVNRVIIESIMNINYFDDWKREQAAMCTYIKENAGDEVFDDFEDLVDRVTNVVTDEALEYFNSKDSFIWFGLFSKFIDFGIEDKKFVDFMEEFGRSLHDKKVNGCTYDELCEEGHTKNKATIEQKMELLMELMREYLHIEEEVSSNNEPSESDFVLDFVKMYGDSEADEDDISTYEEYVEDVVRISSPLYQKCKVALLAMTAYVFKNETDNEFEEWIEEYSDKELNFSEDQKENYLHMKNEFEKYLQKEVA